MAAPAVEASELRGFVFPAKSGGTVAKGTEELTAE